MTLRHMRIFVAVCECGGITAAAQQLYLAQPTVSLAVSELEEYYGVRLFDRISRRLFITQRGQEFYEYAKHIVSLFDEMERSMKDADSAGMLRLGSSITIATFLLPDLLCRFRRMHPGIQAQVRVDNSEEIEHRVSTNEVDFGLIEGVVHSEHMVCEEFARDALVLVCGQNHPLAQTPQVQAHQLKGCDFLLRQKGSGTRELFDSTMLLHGVEITPVWESVSTQAIVEAVCRGLGISVLPYRWVQQDLREGRLHRLKIEGVRFEREFTLIYHKNKFLSQATQDFLALCRDTVGENLPEDD